MWAARNPGVPQPPDVLENSVTDQRAPFLAVLDPSGVSPPGVGMQLYVQQT
jgi:hypothetical protein